ncbi:MAG: GntR family transcriptional regulator [Alphaproteobacteria bacterium]|nr:GntR family transcriptional regulator [Alphaproteobacteria bacterium]
MARSDEDVLTERLLADRASGRLAEEVSETELIQQYGVPRGVIRRVLMRLASEGVTERATGHGWRFAAVLSDRRALQESYRFRLLIETSVFGQPEFRLPAREVIRLRLVQEDLAARASSVTHAEYFETNRMFHERLAAAGNNRFLYQAVRQQLNLRRLLEFAWPQPITAEVIARQCHEHIAILAALEANDRPAAARFMQSHLADAIGAQS